MYTNSNLSRNLLIVDDDIGTLKSLSRSLKFLFKNVDVAPSAKEALSILSSKEIHVVLSDYNMAGMDGVELLTEIKKLYKIPVIIMTGHANVKAVISFANNHAYKVIEKPFKNEILEEVFDNLAKKLDDKNKKQQMHNLGEMTSIIMHEINNPLGILLMRSNLLKMGVESGSLDQTQVEKHITSIDDMTQKVVKIIAETRDMITGKELKSVSSIVDTSKLKELLEAQINSKGYNSSILNCNLENVKFPFDQSLLEQILCILLNNSLDEIFKFPDQWIKIEGKHLNEKDYEFKITDSGKGIPKERQEELFIKGSSGKKSTGLGLFLSKKLLNAKNSTIEYNPNSENTQFIIKITRG